MRAYPAVLCMWPHKNISHILESTSFSYLLVSNPIHKIKTGMANTWEITNNNSWRLIKLSSQSEIRSTSYLLDSRLFHALGRCVLPFKGHNNFSVAEWTHGIWLSQLIQDFQCRAKYWTLVELLKIDSIFQLLRDQACKGKMLLCSVPNLTHAWHQFKSWDFEV
jgi:hypothetical protein